MSEDVNPLEYVSQVEEFMEMNEWLQDNDLQEALNIALKCIVKPQIPSVKAAVLVTQLQAYSLKFQLMAVLYQSTLAGTADSKNKKNIYYAMYYALDKLVNALKIQTRYTDVTS